MRFIFFDTVLIVSPSALAAFSLAVYAGKNNLAAIIISVLVHEAGHIFVMKLLNTKIRMIRFDPWGLCIECFVAGGEKDKLLSAIAGPAAGATLCIFCLRFSELSFFAQLFNVSMKLTVLNILPCLPLDGGTIAVSVLELMFPGRKLSHIIKSVSNTVSSVFMTAGVILLGTDSGIFLVIIGIYIIYFNLHEAN